ncbi:MAG TPA: ABC transporter permease [Patescibacteria group bacterium]|nr:ABC transporter permease [Patescibacteria group bacterium]
MKLHRIYAIVLRYIYLFRRSYDRLSDVFYWPTIDLIVWGLTSAYLKTYVPNASPFILIIVSGILLWLIVWRAQYEISVNLLEELWNKNLINIFVSPLKFSEWIVSFLIVGIVKASVSVIFAMGVAFLLYKAHIFLYGLYLIPFFISLMLTGWWIGFIVAGIILRYGTRVQTLAWSLVAVFAPFSAIYYPISILPNWAQAIAAFIPVSYIFEGSRQIIETGHIDISKLFMSFTLNILYLFLAFVFLKRSFKKVLRKGLVKVD